MTGFSVCGMSFGLITALCSSFFLTNKFFAVFQQTSYRGREYIRKLIICVPGRIIALFCVGLLYGVSVYFTAGKRAVGYVPLLSFALVSACIGVVDKPVVKISFTARMKRVFITGTAIFVVSGAILGGFVFSPVVGFLLASLSPAVPLSGALPWLGYDRAKYRQAKEKCKQKLAEHPDHGKLRKDFGKKLSEQNALGIVRRACHAEIVQYAARGLSRGGKTLRRHGSFSRRNGSEKAGRHRGAVRHGFPFGRGAYVGHGTAPRNVRVGGGDRPDEV